MKTRKIIAYILAVVTLLGLLTGCGKKDEQPTLPAGNNAANQNTEATKTTDGTQATEATKATEATQATTATDATQATDATEVTKPTCIHMLGTEWKVTVQATCTDEGSRYKTCTLCGDKVAETIPKLDHVPDPWQQDKGKEATCKQEGVMYQKCHNCDKILIYINTEKLPHTPNGDNCKVCGEALSTATQEDK